MHLVFLSARVPLTKTFAIQNGKLISKPYPLVSRVTSHNVEIETLQDFHAALIDAAKHNRCLFSGHLQHPLVDESRASKTIKNDRTWVCFDFDKVDAKDHGDVVKKYLPDTCQNVSYIVQPSASMFKPDTTHWSGHIFMLLKTPVPEKVLKQWFEHLNFKVPALAKSLSLTDSLQALRWPLDRTVADCSKIIYIAPPICAGFTSKISKDKAFTLVKKKTPSLAIPLFEAITHHDIRVKINELRAKLNEPPLDYNIQTHNGVEVMLDAAECEVHGVRQSGEHFLRFNLNGGDSYAYYIDLRNPGLIGNFKGEPFLRTDEAAPELYKTLKKTAPKTVASAPLDEDADVFAFYATNRSSAVYIGQYSPVTRKLDLNNSSETPAKGWLNEWSIPHKGFLPHVEVVFDPQSDIQYMPGSTLINTFRASDYMMKPKTTESVSKLHEIPPAINKTIRSMLGNPDDDLLIHYINWLAFIFQTRSKSGAAWVLHGAPGTGKSMFIRAVLTPLFGPEHVKVVQFGQVTNQFNAFLENTLFVVFEEADTKAVDNHSDLMSKLKHWITDSPIEINQKGIKTYAAPSYSNFIFNSNERTPVNITDDDRRFNIANRQENKIVYTPNELYALSEGTELDAFADVLHRWPVDRIAASKVIDSQAKVDIHEATTGINQLIAEAIIHGDLQFFIDRTPSDNEAAADFHNRFNPLLIYKSLIAQCQQNAEKGEVMLLTEEQVFILFRTLITDNRYFQDSKTWRKRHYKAIGLDVDRQHRMPGKPSERHRGIMVNWTAPEFPIEVTDKADKVVKLRGVTCG